MNLETVLANYPPQRRDQTEEPPEDSNISVGGPEQKRVRLDDLLARALADVGYTRVAKLAYRAEWSTPQVEHILNFETQGTPKIFMFADAGLRNAEAEAFAERCQRRYTIPVIRDSKPASSPWFCPMHFSLGALAGWRAVSSYLNTLELSQAELTRIVQDSVTARLKPYVGGVTTLESLLEFLERDEEPMRWFRVGGFYRAALIVFLARSLGFAPHRIEATLLPLAREVLDGVDTAQTDSDGYVADIIRDADIAIAAGLNAPTAG